MDTTKSMTGFENGWNEEPSLSAVLKSRLAVIDQRHGRNNQSRIVYNPFSQNGDFETGPIIDREARKDIGDGDYFRNVLMASDAKLEDGEIISSARGDGVDELDRASKTEEDGASCYLCTHCGKGYDSEQELDRHLRQVRSGSETSVHARSASDSRGAEDGVAEDEDFLDEDPSVRVADDDLLDEEDVFAGSIKLERSSSLVQGGVASSDSPSMTEENQQRRRSYSCKFCNKPFDSNSALNVHYTHTHRDKPQYECDLCGKVYSVKRELATHRRLHDGQPTHRCRQCGKEFGTKQLLRKHELWHTGERNHVCPQCGKAFFQKGHLTQHMMIHAGGRPHACHLCQKTFIFKFDLNRHMKIHAERVGNAEESPTAEIIGPVDLVAKSASFESGSGADIDSANQDDSIGATDADETAAPTLMDGLFPMGASTAVTSTSLPVNAVIQQLHQQQNSGHHGEGSGAGASPFGLLRSWNHSSGFMDHAANGQDQQHRAALAAAFAQALCHAQQQASLFAGFSASSPPLPQLFFEEQRHKHLQQQRSADDQKWRDGGSNAVGVSEHDSTSGSSPATLDEHRETASVVDSPPPPSSTCDSCREYHQRLDASQKRIQELERDLSRRQSDVEALNSKIQRVADVASRLLESCSDFDKLWMLHSKQVYSQIQNILNALD